MINFINKTVEILAHILYNKGQANQEGLLAFTQSSNRRIKHEFKKISITKRVVFLQQVFCSELGIKALSSKDAKNLYTKATAAVLRAKDCVLNVVSNIQENAQDIYAGAQQINDERAAAEDAAEAEGQDEVAETVAEEETKTEEKAE